MLVPKDIYKLVSELHAREDELTKYCHVKDCTRWKGCPRGCDKCAKQLDIFTAMAWTAKSAVHEFAFIASFYPVSRFLLRQLMFNQGKVRGLCSALLVHSSEDHSEHYALKVVLEVTASLMHHLFVWHKEETKKHEKGRE